MQGLWRRALVLGPVEQSLSTSSDQRSNRSLHWGWLHVSSDPLVFFSLGGDFVVPQTDERDAAATCSTAAETRDGAIQGESWPFHARPADILHE